MFRTCLEASDTKSTTLGQEACQQGHRKSASIIKVWEYCCIFRCRCAGGNSLSCSQAHIVTSAECTFHRLTHTCGSQKVGLADEQTHLRSGLHFLYKNVIKPNAIHQPYFVAFKAVVPRMWAVAFQGATETSPGGFKILPNLYNVQPMASRSRWLPVKKKFWDHCC